MVDRQPTLPGGFAPFSVSLRGMRQAPTKEMDKPLLRAAMR
jgi:hypothetical protein